MEKKFEISGMIVDLNIRCGTRQFKATVNVEDDQSESSSISVTETASTVTLKTVGDLYRFIAAETNSDPAKLKIIHKGKSVSTNFEEPLKNYKFDSTDNLMVMGARNCVQSKTPDVDPGLQALNDYEKKNLVKLSETFQSNSKELSELERNFLEGDMAKEMIKRMDRQLQAFNDTSIKHLENIDGLTIFNDSTSKEQKTRNREKRKMLINGIQDLLNANDKLIFQLSQHSFRTEHPDEGR